MLKGTEYDTGLDLKKLAEIAEYFEKVRKKYAAFESEHTAIDTNVLIYQIPGGMMSNLASQLREAKKEDKIQEVLEEVPRVKADLGLHTAGHADLADRRHPGDPEHHHRRAVQDGHQRDQEPGARAVRQDAGGDRPPRSAGRSSGTRSP